tara:strand:+ start:896 stop:1855 length:960 start_codon:yes stop_codon:yes gene_type:complete
MAKYKSKVKKKFSTGGNMYAPNEVLPGLNPTSTTNIVFNETNPLLQEQRETKLDNEIQLGQEKSAQFAESYKQGVVNDKLKVEEDATKIKNTSSAIENTVGQGINAATSAALKPVAGVTNSAVQGLLSRQAGRLTARSTKAIARGSLKRGAKLAAKAAGKETLKKTAINSAKTGTKAAGLLSTGSLMSIGGQVISGLSNDNDATKWNAGEVTGDIMSSAGTGAMLGSVIPGVGNLIGGVVGGLYGLGKGLFGRRKARRQAAELKSAQASRTKKHNEMLNNSLTTAKSNARAGEIQQKTYSGYDMGTNISAKYGGMKKYI